jgi:PKD domain
VLWLLAGAAPVLAAQRYASPGATNTGPTCSAPGTSPGPCSIQTAIDNAGSGDQVIVEPGDYGSAASPMTTELFTDNANVTIQAAPGPRPTLFFANVVDAVGLNQPGQSISGLDIEATAGVSSALFLGLSTSADRMYVHNTAGTACSLDDSPIDNSVCWAQGADDALFVSPDAFTDTVTLRNDTVEAGPGGNGLYADAAATSSITVDALNMIIHGGSTDVVAKPATGDTVTINLGYSNYVTHAIGGTGTGVINQSPAGSDQTLAPAFVNAGAGDFHELASSAGTVDRGHDDGSIGIVDLDGNPRIVGPAPDIGAYEHQPPTVSASVVPTSVRVGAPAMFTAVGTPSDPGDVLSYSWTFDDGARSSTAVTSHAFALPGTHRGTVTVTDASGLTATASPAVTVLAAPSVAPTLSSVSQLRSRWREGTRKATLARSLRPRVGTKFSFTLNEAAKVVLIFTYGKPGRRVRGRCVAPSHRNRRRPRCRRTVTAGTLLFNGHPGRDIVAFQGVLSRTTRLSPGRYTVTITALNAAGQRSSPRSLSFTIVR